MPKNNTLNPVKLPMKIGFGKEPYTPIVNNLFSIKVELIDYPTVEELLRYIPNFVGATWAPSAYSGYTRVEKEKFLKLKVLLQ